jgi:hypothetical protein
MDKLSLALVAEASVFDFEEAMAPRFMACSVVFLVPLLVGLAGCADDGIGTTYPVSGKVLRPDGSPLSAKMGNVLFKPDAEKGNKTTFEPAGVIDESGNYVLYTRDRRGAPPGWYNVIVTATGDPPAGKGPMTHRPIPKQLVPAKYGQATTTPLHIEVVASPEAGAYDLKLKD